MELIFPNDARWPASLKDMGPDEPGSLYVHGQQTDLQWLSQRSVAIVGSRQATAYGCAVASSLASALAEDGWTIVSGGAVGIDTAAHRGALAIATGSTVCVLPCGVSRVYPPGNGTLFTEISQRPRCALVSEYHPDMVAYRSTFLRRDKIMAGLVKALIAVEATTYGGTMYTVHAAQDLDRHVMAVPGPVTSAVSEGTNQLLAGCDVTPAMNPAQVVRHLNQIGATR